MRRMPVFRCPDCATRQYAVVSFIAEVRCGACSKLLAAPKDPAFGGWRLATALEADATPAHRPLAVGR
jgi:hypothetical protein